MGPSMYRRLRDTLVHVTATISALVPLDTPIGWGEQPDVNMVNAVLILVGIPLLLFVLIAIAVYLPSVLRGESLAPGAPPWRTSGWAVRAPAPRSWHAEAETVDAGDAGTGGASGRW